MTPASTTTKSGGEPASTAAAPAAGTVTDSLKVLARNSRDLLTDVGNVLERELAMAVSLSERLRDESVSAKILAEARAGKLQAGLRDSSHRIVDLVADAVGVAAVSAVRFGDQLVDQPRKRLAVGQGAAGKGA